MTDMDLFSVITESPTVRKGGMEPQITRGNRTRESGFVILAVTWSVPLFSLLRLLERAHQSSEQLHRTIVDFRLGKNNRRTLEDRGICLSLTHTLLHLALFGHFACFVEQWPPLQRHLSKRPNLERSHIQRGPPFEPRSSAITTIQPGTY